MKSPDDKITFPKYNGQSLRNVYLFDPRHLDWLMVNHKSFCIDVEKFSCLPSIEQNDMAQQMLVNALARQGGMPHEEAVLWLHKKGTLRMGKYQFSKGAILANEKKIIIGKKLELEEERYQAQQEAEDKAKEYNYRGNVIDDAFDGDASAMWNID